MCFQMFYRVDDVPYPDVSETFRVFKDREGMDGRGSTRQAAIDIVDTMAMHHIENYVVRKVLEMIEGVTPEINIQGLVGSVPDRSIVVCSTMSKFNLNPKTISKEIILPTRHSGMENTIVILQLKDFSYAAMYSYEHVSEAELPDGLLAMATVKMKFGLESERIIVHKPIGGTDMLARLGLTLNTAIKETIQNVISVYRKKDAMKRGHRPTSVAVTIPEGLQKVMGLASRNGIKATNRGPRKNRY